MYLQKCLLSTDTGIDRELHSTHVPIVGDDIIWIYDIAVGKLYDNQPIFPQNGYLLSMK